LEFCLGVAGLESSFAWVYWAQTSWYTMVAA